MIVVDWGTSRVRAALLSLDGSVKEERQDRSGVGEFGSDEFASHFDSLVSGFPVSSVLAAGMVGSRQGWREAPYISCPASLDSLTSNITFVESRSPSFAIVPGVKYESSDRCDIMRGEETAIMGLLLDDSDLSGIVILPGTHTKWVRVESGRIIDFRTYMTGELFEILCTHSILRHSVPGDSSSSPSLPSADLFGSLATESESLMGRLFGLRASDILGLDSGSLREKLSAMLVMDEVRCALSDGYESSDYILVGSVPHIDLWGSALRSYDKGVHIYESDSLVWRTLFGMGDRIGLWND